MVRHAVARWALEDGSAAMLHGRHARALHKVIRQAVLEMPTVLAKEIPLAMAPARRSRRPWEHR